MAGRGERQAKRDKFSLMIEILNNANEPIKKTHLVYKAGINFHQLERYLDLLVALGLIRAITQPVNGYQITEKGTQFLTLLDSNRTTNQSPESIVAQVI